MSYKQLRELEEDYFKDVEQLKRMSINNHEFLVNSRLGYFPFFTVSLKNRVKRRKVVNGVITGEAGDGKSYITGDLSRNISRYFDVDSIVFEYLEFMQCVMVKRRGTPIEFDEPSYAMSKRDWYKDLNKALVKTVESFRFKGKPLFIPIINKALLDSDIRNYLVQFHVTMQDRGEATAYRCFTSQFERKNYNYEICKLKYGLYDLNLCNKDCLTCSKLDPKDKEKRCMIFRATYERKKKYSLSERYDKAVEEAEVKAYSKLDLNELTEKAVLYFDKFFNEDKGKIDIDMLKIVLLDKEKIRIGHNKKYEIAKNIKYQHPELFPDEAKPEIHKDNIEKVT
jgi:hypothetical protein